MCQLREVLKCLKEAGLTCRLKKCEFGRARLVFLGHEIGNGVLSVPEARIKALSEHPKPNTKKQMRAFLGLANYYRRFIKDFHVHSSVLTPSTSKSAPVSVSWTDQMEVAFGELKSSLCNRVCLCIPVLSDMFVLETDASSRGVGAVLSVDRDGEVLPVAFFSRQLHGAQVRYSAQELEGLAVFEAVTFFAYYLYGRPFKIVTDHKSLTTLMSSPQNNRRLLNWALKLAIYDFVIVYRQGCDNVAADCLSRGGETEKAEDGLPLKRAGGDVGTAHMK